MPSKLKGVYAILATPFTPERKIDEASLRSLVDFELEAGVHGITILGVLGEVLMLSDDERNEVTRTVIDQVHGRVPVVSGTGAPGTDLAIMYSENAQEHGTNAVMLPPPKLTKPNDEALGKYYRDVADRVNVPIVVQDEPVTYQVHMSPNLIAQLSEIEGVEYVKLEDAPTPAKISSIRNLIGEKMGIFGGLGGLYAYEELSRGAVGVMTGFAYPEILVAIYNALTSGDREGARSLFYRALPLIRYEAQPNISLAIRKHVLLKRGAIKNAVMREPAPSLSTETAKELDEILRAINVDEVVAASRKIAPAHTSSRQ